MIGRSIGVLSDAQGGHLSADLINPLFAFSLNRKLRYLYDGEYFRFKDKNGEADYPSTTPDMSEDVELLRIYDQKEKFGYDKEDAVVGLNLDPDFELPSGPNNGHHRDFNYVGTDLVRPKIIALRDSAKKMTKGEIYEVSLIRFQGGGFICRFLSDEGNQRFVGNRGVEYEVVTEKTQISATFNQSEYLEISGLAQHVGTNFTITARGDGGDLPRPMFGLWGATEKTINTEDPSIQLPTEPNNGNDYVFPTEERPLVVSLKTDSGKGIVAGDIYRLRRFRVSNMNGQIEKLDGTDPRWIGIRGAAYEVIGAGMATFFTEDAGVLTVCDPSNSEGRAPIFSASNNDNELCFDVGSAYMRINHYKISERHQLFGGLDSPDQEYNAYLGNFSEKTVIRNSSGFSGVSLRKDAISSGLTEGYIGRDATGNTYSGEIYELIIGDFEIPNDSVNEAFRDMIDFYALT